jgi:cytosine/uracil/thiamine/allantoin permease
VNVGDFSRYCKKTSATYIQIVVIPLILTVLSIFAAITASCTAYVYGDAGSFYQPYDVTVSPAPQTLRVSLTRRLCGTPRLVVGLPCSSLPSSGLLPT